MSRNTNWSDSRSEDTLHTGHEDAQKVAGYLCIYIKRVVVDGRDR